MGASKAGVAGTAIGQGLCLQAVGVKLPAEAVLRIGSGIHEKVQSIGGKQAGIAGIAGIAGVSLKQGLQKHGEITDRSE